VLEEMADAGDAGPLVARSDPEEAVERRNGERAIPKEADLQPVAERVLVDGKSFGSSGHPPRYQPSSSPATGFIISCSAGVISFFGCCIP